MILVYLSVECERRLLRQISGGNYFGCRRRPDGIGYFLVLERKIEELCSQIKRWTYKGKPTKKARKLKALEAKMEIYEDHPSIYNLLSKT